jgi:hypothetical protein
MKDKAAVLAHMDAGFNVAGPSGLGIPLAVHQLSPGREPTSLTFRKSDVITLSVRFFLCTNVVNG